MIYWQHMNVAQFHIPRTGGTACRCFLNSLWGKANRIIWLDETKFHEKLYKKKMIFEKIIPESKFDITDIVTTIRNPFEMLISLYCYLQQSNDVIRSALTYKEFKARNEIVALNFHDFVKRYINNNHSFKDYLFIDGKIPDNVTIIKLESFSKEIVEFLEKVGQKPELIIGRYDKRNSASRNKYECTFPSELINKVYDKFKWTFDNYYKDDI